MLAGASVQASARTGTVHFMVVKVGFIVGVGGGHGTLTYAGRVTATGCHGFRAEA